MSKTLLKIKRIVAHVGKTAVEAKQALKLKL